MRLLGPLTFVLLSPLVFVPFIFLIHTGWPWFVIGAYLVLAVIGIFALATAFRVVSDTATGVLLGVGVLGILVSMAGVMTWGWITIWPSLAMLALGLTALVRTFSYGHAE